MRKNGYSKALVAYNRALLRARALRDLEVARFKDPPPPSDQATVEALRGGAVVLMSAALETYLRDALQEYIDAISNKAKKTTHPNLPAQLVENNDFNFVAWVVRNNREKKAKRITEIRRAAKLIAAEQFLSEAFNRTQSNPGSSTIKTLFSDFGINDPFTTIEINFAKHFKRPIIKGYVSQKIDSIVSARNEVAHEASAMNLSRLDIRTYLAFLHLFGKAADNTLRDQAITIINLL